MAPTSNNEMETWGYTFSTSYPIYIVFDDGNCDRLALANLAEDLRKIWGILRDAIQWAADWRPILERPWRRVLRLLPIARVAFSKPLFNRRIPCWSARRWKSRT